ncbi:AAA family ATPase [Xanthomonas citri]|uniref:AAA family ATPase n=1 Tax=Xanthomonas citri TaxID=346 RepID=UPI001CC062F2|nr:AAA family ATPase [Xanthomonas citri]
MFKKPMTIYGKDSGIAATVVRVSNFRSLANIEVELEDLTVLIGANNSGKTSFLDAMFAAVGAGRKTLSADDVRLELHEAVAPKNRDVVIDVLLRPVDDHGKLLDQYPVGSFWTALWGTGGIATDADFNEFTPIRTKLKWSDIRGEYVMERRFLKEWRAFSDWLTAAVHDRPITAAQMEPLALHYVDAKRDLDDDLRRQGSFWRRLTEDLGLSAADIAAMEMTLSGINQEIVNKSEILKHLKDNLSGLQRAVSTCKCNT